MADPLDMNPFLTESQRRKMREMQPSQLSAAQMDQLNLQPVVPIEEQLRGLREAEAANPEYLRARDQARAEMENRVMQRTRDAQSQNRLNAVSAGVGQEFPGMNPQDLMGMSVGELEQMRAQQQPNFNIKGIPADSQYAQRARQQAGISEAEFDRRMQRSGPYFNIEGIPADSQYAQAARQQAGISEADFEARMRENMRQLEKRKLEPLAPLMFGGRNMDDLRRQFDAAQRMEVQRAPQRQTPLVVARDEQIQGSDRGDMGRFYGPDGRVEDIDPLLIKATPQPRTSAQLGESARAKAGSGQPLDAEERQWFSSTIRKQMQDAGYTEEQIQRQMERIDPETGMLPRRMR